MTQNKNIKYGKKKGGFSLMEILFVLAIISGLVIAAVTIYNQNQNTANAKQIAQDIQTLSSGIKTSFSADQQGYTDAKNVNIVKLGIVPKTLTFNTTSGVIKNKYNGDVTITSSTPVDNNSEAFSINETKLPKDVINKVLTQLGTEGMVAISIGTSCIYTTGAEGADLANCTVGTAHPYSTKEVAAAIEASGTTGDITIAYGQ